MCNCYSLYLSSYNTSFELLYISFILIHSLLEYLYLVCSQTILKLVFFSSLRYVFASSCCFYLLTSFFFSIPSNTNKLSYLDIYCTISY